MSSSFTACASSLDLSLSLGFARESFTLKLPFFLSQIIMRLPDDAEVSDELWDEVLDSMKLRVRDKVPAVRAFAVRALSRFVNDGDDSDITNLFLQTLCQEQNTVCLSYGYDCMYYPLLS